MDIDLLDRKIIYELGKNARISYRELAKKISSKKEVVAYRIANLIKNKVITKFVPVFSLTKLGIFSGKIYINLKGMKNDEQVFDWLIKNKEVAWVAKSVGNWDLLIGFYYRDILDFARIKNEVLSKLSKYVKDYEISFIEDGLVFNREYLVGKDKIARKEFIFGGNSEKIQIDEIDKKIISLIRNDGRFEYLDVAKKLNLDARTILTRIENLKEKEILQGFTIFIDLNKIGYKLYKICISLNSLENSSKEKVIQIIKGNPNVIHLIKAVSSWDLEAEIEYTNIEEIYSYINYLKNELPEIIKNIDFVAINQEVKLDFFPESIL
ncbi:MAG: Lrp/AsnC family transcriptional regulator [Nanoarchaeota archaeon]